MFDLPRPKKRFYKRWWFVLPFYSLLLLGIAGGIVYWKVSADYEARAKSADFDYDQLEAMESASLILDRKGQVMGRIFTQNREQVALSELSNNLVEAVIAREDERFRQHKGVDYKGVVRAIYKNWRAGRDKEGASTITQQLARNTFPDKLQAKDRSKDRKLLEMFVAFEIEKRCAQKYGTEGKNKILELYLNRVYFGNGFFGAEAASKGYFGKQAKDLTVSEAALLAGLLRSPDHFSPWRDYEACKQERNVVLNNMLSQQRITREQYDAAFKDDLLFTLRNKRQQQDSHAADMVYQQVLKKVGKDQALGEGLRIYTTIDPAIQKKAEESLRAELASIESRPGWDAQTFSQYDQIYRAAEKNPLNAAGKRLEPEYLQGAVVMLDNHTGGILALVGGRDFQHSALNRTTQVQVPPGTAFTPLVFTAAFENGFFPGTALQDTQLDNTKVMMGGETGILGEWGPERADNRYDGTISARTALVKSKNGATARMGMMTGSDAVLELAEDAGITSKLAAYPKTYLGGSEVAPMDLTLAYTMFPRGGTRPTKPFIISRIEDRTGKVIFQETVESTPVISETTAYEINTCLAQAMDEGGSGERANLELGLSKYPLGGKTGTAYNYTDLWFCGYSSEVTTSVWVGFDKQRNKGKRPVFKGAFSKDIALPVWAEVMKASFADYKPKEFIQPQGLLRLEICRHSGGLACPKCVENGLRTTYFEMASEKQAPRDPCPEHSGITPSLRPGEPGTVKARVVRPENMQPIAISAPAVIGQDPYGAEQAVERFRKLGKLGNALAPMQTTQDIPLPGGTVDPANAPAPVPVVVPPAPRTDVQLDHPEPLKFN